MSMFSIVLQQSGLGAQVTLLQYSCEAQSNFGCQVKPGLKNSFAIEQLHQKQGSQGGDLFLVI